MGLTTEIVGVDNYSDWPVEVEELPRLRLWTWISTWMRLSVSARFSLASLSVPGMEKNITRLQEKGCLLSPLILRVYLISGIICLRWGKQRAKKRLARMPVSQILYIIEQVTEFGMKIEERPSLYWEWWPSEVFTPGGTIG